MEQSIRELLEADEAELSHRISEVERLLQRKFGATSKLVGSKEDLPLLQRGLDESVFSARNAGLLQNVGLAFGAVAVAELGLRWVMVEDEYGTDPALQDPDSEQVFHALTLVSARLEGGKCDLKELLAALKRRDRALLQAAS